MMDGELTLEMEATECRLVRTVRSAKQNGGDGVRPRAAVAGELDLKGTRAMLIVEVEPGAGEGG